MRFVLFAAVLLGWTGLWSSPARAQFPPPSLLLLSDFDGTPEAGEVVAGSSWEGNVTQGLGYITVGGFAGGDNGWHAHHLSLDATGMNSLKITAQRETGNAANSLFLQFEDDPMLRTIVFSVDTTDFAVGYATEVTIPLGSWDDFDYTHIYSWNLGGGGLGTEAFAMTFYRVEFSSAFVRPVPEPTATVAAAGGAALGVAAWRRRNRKATRPGAA